MFIRFEKFDKGPSQISSRVENKKNNKRPGCLFESLRYVAD